MEKKYYDLIISLIKGHKKYPGLEAILEDIANDAYEHSKVVIGSVTNEEVITAYLNKVVSTSIITVPKKMNFSVKTRHRIITTLIPQTTEAPIPAAETLTTSPIDTVEEEASSLEEILDTSDEIDTNQEELQEEEPTLICEQDILTEEEDALVLEQELQEEISTEEDTIPSEYSTEQVDKNLVDMMINGVSNKEILEEDSDTDEVSGFYESLDSLDNLIEADDEDDALTVTEDVDTEEIESIELDTPEVSDIATEIDSADELETIDLTAQEIIEEEPEELIENEDAELEEAETEDIIVETLEEQTLEEDSEEVETEINIDSQEVSLEIVELDQANAIEIEDNSEIEIFEEEDISLDSFSEEDNELLEANDIEIFEHNTDNEAFKIPNFGCFNYEPENIGYDSEEILSYLLDIDEKHPERKILAICDLKYKQGLSVLEIASKLEFTEEEVLDILNEIIDTIKD